MTELSFSGSIRFSPNKLLTAQEVIDSYLQGVVLSYKNKTVPNDMIDKYIDYAQSYIERYLSIKFSRQLIQESQDLYYSDWENWSFLSTNLPVVCPKGLDGYVSNYKVVSYPKEWISFRKNSDPAAVPARSIRLIPNSTAINFYGGYFYTTYLAMNGMGNINNNLQIPNYWQLNYVTGWEPGKVPAELVNIVGKLAAIQVLTSVGEVQFNLIGVSSQSLSLDGLSQTIATAAGAQHPFSTRIKTYTDQVTNDLKSLLELYKQPILMVF